MPMDHGKRTPAKEHPCGGGAHYLTVKPNATVNESIALLGLLAALTMWSEFSSPNPEVTPDGASLAFEFSVLPASGVTPVPLRI